MRNIVTMMLTLGVMQVSAQELSVIKNNQATAVKNQALTGTCWCFSTTSLVESECIRTAPSQPQLDLSEMFTVRNIYIEKAKNYILRQGYARFDEGGLGHDAIRAIAVYGAVPERVYSGLPAGQTSHNHSKMVPVLKAYLDSTLKLAKPIPEHWLEGFTAILDVHMGKPPAEFEYNGRRYTPKSFAKDVLKFNAGDYVMLTSFTHHPYYQSFIVEVPDNFSNGAYFNVPLKELIDVTKTAIKKGYTVMWDADVSNKGWLTGKGYAFAPAADSLLKVAKVDPDVQEVSYTPEYRQRLYEELVTEDDHLMHITGLSKSANGKEFFVVKNSWGEKTGPFQGYMNVSEPYFAVNTITIIVPKAAIDKSLLAKQGK
ncbi:C1 family peptidase [Chitinophaga pendula]|uniref:C1 family peptidase n=1 Tax=Chitinophaga TaxID=79328 RepID=UPI000BAEBC42|nr:MULTISPECIES: C1 family peptidase [Chitinophaga]ASZ13956.1 aminopeptidase [Chitinophaga sp. MD30]UCJ08421.1 C1 family peptidase [Chitinophaga pendula]